MIGRSVLDMLIERSLIVHEARINSRIPNRSKCSWRWRTRRSARRSCPTCYGGDAADELDLKKKLAQRGESLDEMRESYRLDCLAREFLPQELRTRMTVELPAPEMRAYYNEHLKDFERPATVTWREVVVEVSKRLSRVEARRKAEAVLKRLRGGEEFAKVAERESDGPNKGAGASGRRRPEATRSPSSTTRPCQASSEADQPDPRGPDQLPHHPRRVSPPRGAGDVRRGPGRHPEEVREQTHSREATAYMAKFRKKTLITSIFDKTESSPEAGPPRRRRPITPHAAPPLLLPPNDFPSASSRRRSTEQSAGRTAPRTS